MLTVCMTKRPIAVQVYCNDFLVLGVRFHRTALGARPMLPPDRSHGQDLLNFDPRF